MKVSIIVNCYNGQRYLGECLDSVIAQSYQDWELIFWDNRSADESASLVRNYTDSRIKYFLADTHQPLLYKARRDALEKASGKLLAFLDIDDYWLPGYLEAQVTSITTTQSAFSFTNYFILSQDSGSKKLAHDPKHIENIVSLDLFGNYCVGILALVVCRDAYSRIGGFRDCLHYVGDMDLVLRLTTVGGFTAIGEGLAVYRVHSDNESRSKGYREIQEIQSLLTKSEEVAYANIRNRDSLNKYLRLRKAEYYSCDIRKISSLARLVLEAGDAIESIRLVYVYIKSFLRGMALAISRYL